MSPTTATAERVLTYLLVEDDDQHASIIQHCIQHGEHPQQIRRVSAGADCLSYLAAEEPFDDRQRYPYPDVVLLDIRMGGTLDGLQTLAAIRSDPRHRSLMIVMLTTSDRDQDVDRAYELGANGYVVKSSDSMEMIEQLLKIRWQLGSLMRLPGRRQGADVQEETAAKTLSASKVQSFLQPDEDTALSRLAAAYHEDREGFPELLCLLARANGARFASLVSRFCLERRQLFANDQEVDLAFLQTIIMEMLPQYVPLEKMAGIVASVSAALQNNNWTRGNAPSWHAWQGFCQAYLCQSLHRPPA